MRFLKWMFLIGCSLWLLGFMAFAYKSNSYNHVVPKCDYIAVLTGGNGRIKLALTSAKSIKPKAIFVSGVYEKTTINDILADQQLSGVYVILGKQARNTAENAVEVCEWAKNGDVKAIVLITSDYHMIRTLNEFKKCNALLNITPVTIQTKSKLRFLKKSFKEYHKVLFIYAKGITNVFNH